MIEALMNHLWQSTVFAGAAGLLTWTLRKNGAHTRYWLWCAASCKFLIPFSVLIAFGGHLSWRSTPIIPFTPVLVQFVQPFRQAAAETPVAATNPATGESISPLLLWIGVWVCGTVVVGIYWMMRWLRIREVVSRAKPLRLDIPIPVRSSQILIEPGLVGLFRPVLLLPDGIFERLTPQQLRAILAHEVCHLRRRDNLTAAIHMLVETLFWFHPLVWWLGRRLIVEREAACDETVIGAGNDRETYAEGLLAVCKLYLEWPPVCVSGIASADLKKRIFCIMTHCVARKLDFGRRLLLSAAGLSAVVVPVAFGLVNATPGRAESRTENPARMPVFKSASIKTDKSGNDMFRIEWSLPDHYSATGATVRLLIREAYGIQDSQILEAPSWLNSEKYNIDANVDYAVRDDLSKLSLDQQNLENQHILQGLLADRFQLTFHCETIELPVYALVIGKNGPKLREPRADNSGPDGKTRPHVMRMGSGRLVSEGVPLSLLVGQLSQELGGCTVLDRTGLMGDQDYTLQWTPNKSPSSMTRATQGGQAEAESGCSAESSGASIFTAIQEQLGLKLESQKGPVDVLVIDHVEKPSEN